MASTCDVLVVGAGPAGLAAAHRAAERGARVTLVDDNPKPGGQIWRGASPEAIRWMRFGVEWIAGGRVVAAPEPGVVTIEQASGSREITWRSLILSTGARERFLPFPGWTLPHVTGAGGLQALVKEGLDIVGKRVVVAGSGPLLLAVAKFLRAHGARVSSIAEQAEASSLARFGATLAAHPAKLWQALALRASLAGVPYRTACWPVSAEPGSVTLTRAGRAWSEACDYLACGFGLVPNLELAALFGCAMSATGVAIDEFQRTSVEGIFAAGETTGIGGLELSLVEGEIAGLAAGAIDDARALFGKRRGRRRFASALERAFALRPELRELARSETLLCRCEDVAYGRVRECSNWREAKLATRCGMGACQGRVCGTAAEFLLAWKVESARPPVFPARLSTLARAEMVRPANKSL